MRRRKSKTTKKKSPTWRKQLKDDRFPKLIGAVALLFSAYLAIACISYIFTWQVDQDKVLHFSWSALGDDNLAVTNWLGRFGALLSHMLYYWGFGLPSMFLVVLLGRLGRDLLFGRSLKPFWTFFRKSFLTMLYFSIVFEFLLQRSGFPWGGAFGESTSIWLSNFLGDAGLLLLLMFTATAVAIWYFNPDFTKLNWPVSPKLPSFRLPFRMPAFATSTGARTDKAKPEPEVSKEESIPQTAEEELAQRSLQPTFLERFRAGNAGKPIVLPEEIEDDDKALEFEVPDTKSKKPPVDTSSTELEILDPEETLQQIEAEASENPMAQLQQQLFEEEQEKFSEPYDPTLDLSNYEYPHLELLKEYADLKVEIDREELEANKDQIIETLLNYKIEITKIRATIGPTVTLYEIIPAPGVRISKIKNLEDDIALSLAALGIRIIAPIPGKGTIGIEVPNKNKQIVALREVLMSDKYQTAKMDLPVVLGKTISNEVFVADLAKMPHLLVAGATGQGKSVGVNTILMSLLYKKHPSQLKLVLIDPKKVELFPYAKLDQHFLAFLPDQDEPIITETTKVIHTLNSLCIEMDERYNLLKAAQSRNIKEYNQKFTDRKLNPNNGHRFLPFIVLVIDEFADLIMTAGKEIELPIGRLAQLARAVGIHLIIATQRPSVNIITGVIKANFPVRLAYKVSSKVDSRTILDAGGAEQLIGQGDMLLSLGSSMIRLQCAFVDTPEVENVIDFIGSQRGYPEPFFLPEYRSDDEVIDGTGGLKFSELDDMFEDAARLVVQNQHGSTSMIQRRLKLGYNRAGRIMDQLEAVGIVGPNEGSKAREVLFYGEVELESFLEEMKASS